MTVEMGNSYVLNIPNQNFVYIRCFSLLIFYGCGGGSGVRTLVLLFDCFSFNSALPSPTTYAQTHIGLLFFFLCLFLPKIPCAIVKSNISNNFLYSAVHIQLHSISQNRNCVYGLLKKKKEKKRKKFCSCWCTYFGAITEPNQKELCETQSWRNSENKVREQKNKKRKENLE